MASSSTGKRPKGAFIGGGAEDGAELRLVNQLGESRSPYVRAHATNPVAWQIWTPEALALAKKHNRLLFVSIGYAACHWCHVMERESFHNDEIALLLNTSFIPIKIDREERPDIDRIYMNYVQATTGGGGWPLNVFLTPNLQPLFGGTYWPGPMSATVANEGLGFLDILHKMDEIWKTQQQRCLDEARSITVQLQQFAQEGLISHQGKSAAGAGDGSAEGDDLDLELLEEAVEHFKGKYDATCGGFGGAPKFPTPANLRFLLRLQKQSDVVRDVVGTDECVEAQNMALDTLRAMAEGGIRDQIGLGFARYSVTRDWSLPHFEKMLYDQSQLLQVYLDAYLVTQDNTHGSKYLDVVHDIAAYLTSPPMQSPAGGFFSAEDADSLYRSTDSEKREGAFYVWTMKEFQAVLGDRDAGILAKYYNVQENGNVEPENDAHDELINQNVLAISSAIAPLAKEVGIAGDQLEQIIQDGKQKLLNHRNKERSRPALDDKIVVSWNGLAIGALARTAAAIEAKDPSRAKVYRDAAIKAADFVKKELWDEGEGVLKRVYREGSGDVEGFADDYAFLVSGLLDLYEGTFDARWLEWADRLQKTQNTVFWDATSLGYFSTSASAPDLILRLKDGMDNAEPSTNGISASNLNRLSSILNDPSYEKLAKETALAFEAEIAQHPFLFVSLLDAVVVGKLGVRGVTVTGEEEFVKGAVEKLRGSLVPNQTVVVLTNGADSPWLRQRNALLKDVDASKNRIEICEGGICREVKVDELVSGHR